MKIAFLIFFLLFVSSLASFEAQNTSGFHHYWLVQSWPPVYCQQFTCYNKPTDFVLHGLWPVNSTGHTLKNSSCPPPDIDGMLKNLSFGDEMDKLWPTFRGKGRTVNKGFWKHEWDEHGSGQPYKEVDYFKSAIRLRKNVNLLETLERNGLSPNGGSYPITEYVDAINFTYGFPILACYQGALKEVTLCADDQARYFISCNHRERGLSNCRKNIKFPPIV